MNERERAARQLLQTAAGLTAGIALGSVAWGEDRAPALAVLLPVLVVFCRARLQAFALGFGYSLGVTRYSAAFVATFFDNNLWVGAGAILAFATISGAVWCLGWSPSARVWRRVVASCVAWLLALALNAAIPGHPVIAMGYLLPGSAWAGVLLSIALPAIALGLARIITQSRARLAGAVVAIAALGVASVAGAANPPNEPVRGIQAERTLWGVLRDQDEALSRLQRMGAATFHQLATTVVWPESIIGRYDPSMYQVMDLELLQRSRRAGRTQIIGMDIPLAGNRLLNSAVAFYPDGRTATAVARQPAPFSLWRPWRRTDTFVADWTSQNVVNIGQGDRAAIIFCYEEYMPVLYLLNEALDSPNVYVAMTNTWAAREQGAAAVQTMHSLGMARLFGRPYVKAENRPAA